MSHVLRNFLAGFFLMSTVVACSPFLLLGIGNGHDPAPTPVVVETNSSGGAQKRCETEDDTSIARGAIVQQMEVTLQRHSQRVHRLDCEKKVISDNIEEVVSPNKRIILYAQDLAKDKVAHAKRPIINRTTCDYDQAGLRALTDVMNPLMWIIRGVENLNLEKKAYAAITIDMAKTALNMRVKEGQNYIDYSFHEPCSDESLKSGACRTEDQPLLEKGTLILDVTYEVKQLDGVKEIDDCDSSKTQ